MGRILVLSDIHGEVELLKSIIKYEKHDKIIFCGDGLSDFYSISHQNEYAVPGNVDPTLNKNMKDIVTGIYGKTFFITHGDSYQVKTTVNKILLEAKQFYCDIIVFGHTHKQFYQKYGETVLFNPGSVREGDYGIIENGSEWEFNLKSIQAE